MVSFLIIMPLSTLKLRSGYWQGQNGSCCIKHLKSKELELFARYWFWQYTKNCFCCKTLIDTRKSITMVPKKWLLTLHTRLMHGPLSLESLSGLYGVLYLFIFRCSGWESICVWMNRGTRMSQTILSKYADESLTMRAIGTANGTSHWQYGPTEVKYYILSRCCSQNLLKTPWWWWSSPRSWQ